ncbi:MAG: hypothetical protein HYS17_01030 [Micavibrio aeruginosavorus]|uniref:DUF6782 domain-containing protein n=1 Tax=Micavibrio aeruginosavorus TaxID=349221 RepID=A0A7T5R2P5_9BACT|nr:MAG: hypothetical protein HYS17_01030 [Micavibrio aeruginosavorus]
MSKTTDTDNVTHGHFSYHRRVSLAYTLNNYQPVRCTLIGDQPLFFMDYEGSFEADRFEPALGEEFADLNAIERGVEKLQERVMRALESEQLPFSGKAELDHAEEMVALFLKDSAEATTAGSSLVMGEDADYILAQINKSRFGAALIATARRYETKFVLGGAVSTALYDRRQNTVFINPALNDTDQILLLTRELRRVWQHRNGALVHPLTFHPDQAVLVHRAQVADLCVAMIRIAWEQQLSGLSGPWERLEASSMEDLARAFAREAYMDFRTVNNGEACAAVFEAWFLSERCRQEDRRLIQQMLADYQGYVFDNINPSTQVTSELILALGSQPEGKNYLAPYVSAIMADPLFTEIRDRSNANFLWFIKFERSFRETEQELQTLETNPVSGARQKTQPEVQGDNSKRFGDHNEKADIVPLPRGKAHTGLLKNSRADAPGSATVIEFRSQQPGQGG